MTDAPERIWAVPERNCTVYMSGNSPITAQDGPFTHRLHGAALEYIRADLVEAMLAALDGKSVTSLSDAARLIQQQRYSAVEDALGAADGKIGEDAVTCFLNALRYADED